MVMLGDKVNFKLVFRINSRAIMCRAIAYVFPNCVQTTPMSKKDIYAIILKQFTNFKDIIKF